MRKQLVNFIHSFRVGVWVLFLCFVNVSSVPAEEQQLQFDDIITMLDQSGKQFSFLGTKFIIDFTPSRRTTTLVKVTSGASGWQKKEVSPLQKGESQIILDDGKFLWHYIPSQASVIKKKRRFSFGEFSKKIHRQNELIRQNYHITIEAQPQASQTTVSQIPSVTGDVMVTLQPKTQDRPSWKIWIDSEHGLVVRTEVYDLNGNLALLSAFSELTFQPKISPNSFKIRVPKGTKMRTSVEKHFQTIEEAQEYVNFPISEPEYIPSGFTLASISISRSKQREKVQLAYIDGMSSISVFEEKRAATEEISHKTSKEVEINKAIKGTFHDQGLLKILRWQHIHAHNLYITLVGEVADSELLKIASSIAE